MQVYWFVEQEKFTVSKLLVVYYESSLLVVLTDLVHQAIFWLSWRFKIMCRVYKSSLQVKVISRYYESFCTTWIGSSILRVLFKD